MQRKLQLKESMNNIWETEEILWLLKGNEKMNAQEFVCRYMLNVKPENIMDVFEYVTENDETPCLRIVME